ncbi:cation:proton antiporter regulatory subunit [Methanoplanus endosymbiosus]|uniref:Potassium transporter TrkA n=1 Tax=Methanoplanus endosymbiosus TaxID=33865 RepID=A0A9E7PLU5_9EURY|nr:TrkA C-terminal domain-containing protein [Methanoplanus endosymbiosus]UUX91211.1 potassium transporter TrkA [Methanoplanus endosymbiosus]
MSIRSREMPGIGKKYELDTDFGDRVSVIQLESGGAQLYVSSRNGESGSAELTLSESIRVSNILAGPVLKAEDEGVSMVFSSLSDLPIEIHSYTLGSKTSGKSISDLNVRSITGATVVAVSSSGNSILNPSPEFRFKEGDSVLVIGEEEQIASFKERFL